MTGNKDYHTMNLYASEVNIGSENLVVLPFGNGSERMLNNINLGAHFNNLNLNVILKNIYTVQRLRELHFRLFMVRKL